jgi:hypothetical protein
VSGKSIVQQAQKKTCFPAGFLFVRETPDPTTIVRQQIP